MSLLRRVIPLLLLAVVAWSAFSLPARAQSPAARYAFSDTTLLRDTLDLTFENLFRLADSLRVTPDSLRAFSIRYEMPLLRLAFLADSLSMPVDSVGPVMLREQFNPLARHAEDVTTFAYSTTYTITKQNTSWGNNATYDLVRGPAVLHNVTSVRIDRIPSGGTISYHRSKSTNTEAGWKVLPDVALGARVNLQRTESLLFGTDRSTSQNDFQGSLRSKHDFGAGRTASLNVFGGPFSEPRNSINNATKSGLGTNAETRIEYAPPGWYTFALNGNGAYRRGHSAVPGRTTFDTRDASWSSDGTMNLFPQSRATLRLTGALGHDRNERPTTFTRSDSASTRVDELVQEPSGNATVEAALQMQGGRYGTLNVTADLGHTTRLLATELKDGIRLDRQVNHDASVTLDGQLSLAGWSLDAHFTDARPEDDSPHRTSVSVNDGLGNTQGVTVDYRERGITQNRSANGSLTRPLTPRLGFKARADISLSSYRYFISDTSYLALTARTPIPTSDPHDDYRQSLRGELTYAVSADLSSTVALELDRVATIYLRSDRSSTNREDHLYRAEWLWTYRLLPGLTANQRNQINATYSYAIFAPETDRLSMAYSTATTLNARITPRLTVDLTHNANYGPNGSYIADSLTLADATRDYTLNGRIAYSPTNAFTINLQPGYQANYRDDRSLGATTPTLRRRVLTLSGGANLNINISAVARLSGNISRNLDSRRDVPYHTLNGIAVPQPGPRSESDYWTGNLQFTWNLK